MNKTQRSKLRLVASMMIWPWITACMGSGSAQEAVGVKAVDQQSRFKGVGIVLVVDAVEGAELRGTVFYDDQGMKFYSSSLTAKRNRAILALGGTRVPLAARVIWREKPKAVWGKYGGVDYEGPVVGDYTIPVAERIPDEVLNDIRRRGGALRLKFRLKADGVLFGWDIERAGPNLSEFYSPGGDFLDTKY